jgi:hypothetical protein
MSALLVKSGLWPVQTVVGIAVLATALGLGLTEDADSAEPAVTTEAECTVGTDAAPIANVPWASSQERPGWPY